MKLKYRVLEQCENAKEAALQLASAATDVKNIVLYELAEDILMNKNKIIKANKLDIKQTLKNTGQIMDFEIALIGFISARLIVAANKTIMPK